MVKWVPSKKINEPRVRELLQDSIDANHFTNYGPCVRKLEEYVHKLLNLDVSKSVICVSNGASALAACIASFDLKQNRKLKFVTQSFTFPSSAQGYLFDVDVVDIDEEGGLDLNKVPLTCDGIIVTNVFGNVVDIQKYEKWCTDHNKILIFDNAATSYTSYNGKNSCNYGNGSIISFHHTKPIGFGEGGCIVIDSEQEEYVRRIINFGFNSSVCLTWSKYASNYKMADIQAAYITAYLETFDKIVRNLKELYNYFKSKLQSVCLFPNFSDDTPFLSCFCVLMKNSTEYMKLLLSKDIYCRKYYVPLINSPVATSIYDDIICIPCTIDMTTLDIDIIADIILNGS